MNFDGATGWLVGEPHKGMRAMFAMMNAERIAVGIQGLGIAEASYQNAVAYARERLQGRAPPARATRQARRPDHRPPRRAAHAADAARLHRRLPLLALWTAQALDVSERHPTRRSPAGR